MAQRTLAAGFADACFDKAAAKSAQAVKNEIRVNSRNPRLISLRAFVVKKQNLR